MTVTIPRRKLITLLGSAAVVWPRAVGAQQKLPRIWRSRSGQCGCRIVWTELQEGLRSSGYIEAKRAARVQIGRRKPQPLPGLAAELVALKVDVIVAVYTPAPSQHSVLPVRFRLSFWRATRLKPALSVALLARAAISPAYSCWQQNCMANASNCSATCCRPFAWWPL